MKKLFIFALLIFSRTFVSQNKPGAKEILNSFYSFSTDTGIYQNINGIIVSNGKKWDEVIHKIPIGFNFTLYYDQNDTINIGGGSLVSFNNIVMNGPVTAATVMFENLCDRAYNPNSDLEGDPG